MNTLILSIPVKVTIQPLEKTKTDLPPAALPGAKLLKKFEQNFCLKKRKAPYKSFEFFFFQN